MREARTEEGFELMNKQWISIGEGKPGQNNLTKLERKEKTGV